MKNDLNDITVRVKRLEDAVFSKKHSILKKASSSSSFTGPKGGALLLISNGFFNKKKTAAEVAEKLREQGYHYSATVVQTALRRMSVAKGPLVVLTEAGMKHYVIRK